MKERELAEKYCIFRCRAGSHAYGTSLPTSDVDTRGVFIAPPTHVLSCIQNVEQAEDKAEDTVIYELKKFLGLAANCNPNIIELLFTDERNVLFIDDAWRRIREHRHLFLSKKAKHTFSGYAMSQLHRIKGHNKWINNPQPEQPPSLADFCRFVGTNGCVHRDSATIRALSKACFLTETFGTTQFRVYHSPEFFAEKVGFFNDKETQPKYVNVDDETLASRARYMGFLWINIDEFKVRHKEWKEYWSWKRNRNEARAELEEKHGYDCYAADTEFLTENGWKKFDEITDRDLLATYNQQNARIEYQRAIERHDARYTGNMYCFTGTHTDIRVSGNHRMFVSMHSRNTKMSFPWKFVPACNVPDCFDIKRTVSPKEREFKNTEPCGIDLRFYLKIMGWYVSEGSVAKKLADGTPSVLSISQKQGGRLHWKVSRARSDYMHCGVQINEYSHKRAERDCDEITWTISHRELAAKITSECGIGSKSKKLPRWVFQLSGRMMEILLDAMHAGDGTDARPGDAQIYYTASRQLADDVHELAFLCGFETFLWGPYENGMFQIHINKEKDDSKRLVRSANVHREFVQNERIVCFTVPNEALITRRNGKITIQGNTKHAMHLVRLMRMAQEILTDGKVVVFRPDAQELLRIRNGEFDYEWLLNWAKETDERLNELYETSELRFAADYVAIDELYRKVVMDYWREKGLL